MGGSNRQLHVFLFPFMAHGHMIPIVDIAKLLATRGARATIVTTPLNASYFSESIQPRFQSQIAVRTINFPTAEAGLPENCEKPDQLPSPGMFPLFLKATAMLQHPLEHLLRESRPDCLVADLFFPWATALAAEFAIPTLVFHTHGIFPHCAMASLEKFGPHLNVSSDDEEFVLPDLPHEIRATRSELLPPLLEKTKKSEKGDFHEKVREAEAKSFGLLVNGFYELEPEYADYYRNVLGMRAWFIGPACLAGNTDEIEDKLRRGQESSIGRHECLKWLDLREPNSVIYVCFGTTLQLTDSQLFELALGLEASGQHYVWVVRRGGGKEVDLPEGFEERTKDRGLIIRGWAPQVLILDHRAVGGFMTHCGWNSALEGICAGVPLVTCPGFAEQFWNEKLVTRVWRNGVRVRAGANKWGTTVEGIGREAIADAVRKIMVGEEAEEMRKRAKALKDQAKRAVQEGGSSYSDLTALLQELGSYSAPNNGSD